MTVGLLDRRSSCASAPGCDDSYSKPTSPIGREILDQAVHSPTLSPIRSSTATAFGPLDQHLLAKFGHVDRYQLRGRKAFGHDQSRSKVLSRQRHFRDLSPAMTARTARCAPQGFARRQQTSGPSSQCATLSSSAIRREMRRRIDRSIHDPNVRHALPREPHRAQGTKTIIPGPMDRS